MFESFGFDVLGLMVRSVVEHISAVMVLRYGVHNLPFRRFEGLLFKAAAGEPELQSLQP